MPVSLTACQRLDHTAAYLSSDGNRDITSCETIDDAASPEVDDDLRGSNDPPATVVSDAITLRVDEGAVVHRSSSVYRYMGSPLLLHN